MGASNTKFNKKSTAMEAADNVDLNGKVVLITGCNTGIGKETVRVLAIRGAKVYMLCRNMEKANKAREDIIKAIKEDTANGNKNFDDNKIIAMQLDLSSLLSVRRCVGKYLSLNEPIDYLINNAGVMAIPEWRPSKDNYEMQFATNHLGHFYLTLLLTPLLLKCTPSRVINLASSAHSQSPKIDNEKDNFITQGIQNKDGPLQKDYTMKGWRNYGLSKACNVLFAREYNRRYQKNGIISVSVHPGVIKTELGRHTGSVGAFFLSVGSVFMKSIPQGAATTVRCVSLSNEEIAPGHYYKDCNEANGSLRNDIKPYRGKKTDPPKTTKPATKDEPKKKEEPKADAEAEKKEDGDKAKDEAEATKDEEPKPDANEEDKPKESDETENAPKDDGDKEKDDGDKAKEEEEEAASEPKSEDTPKEVEETKKDEVEEEENKTETQQIEDKEDVNSAEYKLWEWSELLITEKGFKLDMEGFEEEEKERQIQEEKEEAERLEKERLEKEAAEQKAKEEAEKAAKEEEEEKKEDKDAPKEDEEQPKAKEEETVKTEDTPKVEDKPKEEPKEEEEVAADEDKAKDEEAPKEEDAAADNDANEANEEEAAKEEPKADDAE